MAQALPDDIICRARVLQRIEIDMGMVTTRPSSNTIISQSMLVEFRAYWIDSVGVLYLEWNWSHIRDEVVKLLEKHPLIFQHLHRRTEPIDNLSEAGRRAVAIIDSMLPWIFQIVKETLEEHKIEYKFSHAWEELVRNAVT